MVIRGGRMIFWGMLLILCVDGQRLRIMTPQFHRLENRTKPVIRVLPSEIVAGVMRRFNKSIPRIGLSSSGRESSITRIQPIFSAPQVTPRIHLLDELSRMRLRKLSSLIERTNLQSHLQKLGPATLFAPTDEAFSLVSPPNDPRRLRDFLFQHVVRGRILPSDVRNDVTLPSLRSGQVPLRFNVYEDGQMLSVSGSQFLDDARDSENIRIQPIDRVLYPISNKDLPTEVKLTFPKMSDLLLQTSLTSQLTSGTFTLFAPTNDAFDALTDEVSDILMTNSTLLRRVLLNHVVPGTHYSAVLAHGYSLRSLGGELIQFTNRRGLILANGVPVVKADISVNNGVIHAMNRLLLPPELHTRRRPATIAPVLHTDTGTASSSREEDFLPVPIYMEPPPLIPRPLTKTISSPLELPDGQRMTFSTANSLLRRSLLLTRLQNNGSDVGYTILVPTDSAYSSVGQQTLDKIRRNSRLLRRMLLFQMMEGRLDLSAIAGDRPVRSLGGTIIISSLNDGKSLLVGGARVLSIRQAADGMVLVTDRVNFPPPIDNVSGALARFHKLKSILQLKTNIKESLNTEGSVYTVFAPTDEALSTLSPSQLQDQNFISELFWSHTVPGAYYRTKLTPGLQLTTVRGNILTIRRPPTGGIFVNEIPITKDEIVAGNGVVHPIDSLLFVPPFPSADPNSFFEDEDSLSVLAREFKATQFLDWIKRVQMMDVLRSPVFQRSGCTLFLPTDNALSRMSPTLRSVTLGDPERLKKLIRFHFSPQPLSSDVAQDGVFLPTLLHQRRIRCNIYNREGLSGILTVSGVRVNAIRPVSVGSNVSVAIIDDVMAPSIGHLPLTVTKSPMLTNFSKVLKVAGPHAIPSDDGPYTLFAPNACAFAEMDADIYQRLISNKKMAIEFIQRYLVKGCFYSNGLYDGQVLPTLFGTHLTVQITPDCIAVSESKLLYGDMSATNGVLHVISSLVPP